MELTRGQEAALRRAERDLNDGHLTVWVTPDGEGRPDRQVSGAPDRWWHILRDRGVLADPQPGDRFWRPASWPGAPARD